MSADPIARGAPRARHRRPARGRRLGRLGAPAVAAEVTQRARDQAAGESATSSPATSSMASMRTTACAMVARASSGRSVRMDRSSRSSRSPVSGVRSTWEACWANASSLASRSCSCPALVRSAWPIALASGTLVCGPPGRTVRARLLGGGRQLEERRGEQLGDEVADHRGQDRDQQQEQRDRATVVADQVVEQLVGLPQDERRVVLGESTTAAKSWPSLPSSNASPSTTRLLADGVVLDALVGPDDLEQHVLVDRQPGVHPQREERRHRLGLRGDLVALVRAQARSVV